MAINEFTSQEKKQDDFLNNQLDMSNLVSNVVLFLRGYFFEPLTNEITNKYTVTQWNEDLKKFVEIEKVREQLLNEKGIQDIAKNLSFRIQNSLAISNLTKEDVKTVRLAVVDVIWTTLAYNWQEYNLAGVDKFNDIIFAIDDNLMCFYSKTQTGWLSNLISKIINRKEVVNTTTNTIENQKSQGILGKFRGGRF